MMSELHPGQSLPTARGWIVSVDGPKRLRPLPILKLTSSDVDLVVKRASSHTAAADRRAALVDPLVLRRVILFDHIGIVSYRYLCRIQPATDRVDFSIHGCSQQMIARRRHGRALAPAVGGRIVLLCRAEHVLRNLGRQGCSGIAADTRLRTADDVDLSVERGRPTRPSGCWSRRELLPSISAGIITP